MGFFDLTFEPDRDFRLLLMALFLPLVGYVIQISVGRFLPRKGDWLLTTGMGLAMIITVRGLFQAISAVSAGEEFFHNSKDAGIGFSWLYSSGVGDGVQNVVAGVLYDPLGAALFAVVGVVSFLVHLFSTGYMKGDRRYHIFFANISLFTFAMLGLVLSDNLLFLFIFWELMGLMSYLLIGHFSHDPDSHRINHAARACKKAFLTTRVGDVCLFIGMMMFYNEFGTFDFKGLWEATTNAVAANGGEWPAWMTVAGLFVFGGTVGKSAQFPLHIWLPDAMEGPTPVSAMIHAATMVAAGVFLLGRTFPMLSPDVLGVVTAVGATTAIFAATIGMTVFDIKGVLAYSTISQLGFMVAAIGCGGIGLVAGLFHMVTHACFKACLFLCAGSVIHGCHHEQDMRNMGGLKAKMRTTYKTWLVGTLALTALVPIAGWWSKDEILGATRITNMVWGSEILLALGVLVAGMTAFYMWRATYMTFGGEHRGEGEPHESPKVMTIPLQVLAVFSIFIGFVGIPDGTFGSAKTNWFEGWLHHWHLKGTPGAEMVWPLAIIATAVAFAGFFVARGMYRGSDGKDPLPEKLGGVWKLWNNLYYIDAFYLFLVKRVQQGIAKACWFFERWILIQGVINNLSQAVRVTGDRLRRVQTGRLGGYVTSFMLGAAIVALLVLLQVGLLSGGQASAGGK